MKQSHTKRVRRTQQLKPEMLRARVSTALAEAYIVEALRRDLPVSEVVREQLVQRYPEVRRSA